MNIKRIFTFLAGTLVAAGAVSAQSYFDDDIYFDASKASKPVQKATKKSNNKTAVVVYDYPSADNYTVNGTRTISVDDYNRRGIFATDSLTADTTATDFAYTRRIEQFYNPQIVSGSGDEELANIYYMEPDQVNIYVNTPSAYWGYDYFYPYNAWASPYWYNNYWRWNSAWYWGSWYDPYWAWGWGPSWAYPGWSPGWGPGWGYPGWGWGGPVYTGPRRAPNLLAGRHPGVGSAARPSSSGRRPGSYGYTNSRPGVSTNRQPAVTNRRPNVTTNRRPSTTNTRPTTNQRPNNNNNYNNNSNYNNYNPNSIGGRYGTGSYGSGSYGGGSRGSGMGSGGGSRGGRGRH